MEKEINQLKLAVYGDPNLNLGQIVKNENEKKLLLNETEKKINQKVKRTKQIFLASKDGDNPSTFHLKCDDIPNTLVLIEAEKWEKIWRICQ